MVLWVCLVDLEECQVCLTVQEECQMGPECLEVCQCQAVLEVCPCQVVLECLACPEVCLECQEACLVVPQVGECQAVCLVECLDIWVCMDQEECPWEWECQTVLVVLCTVECLEECRAWEWAREECRLV